MPLIIDHIIRNIRQSSTYNPEIQVKPSCILWTDKERQWESLLPQLRIQMSELLTLGDYDPVQRTGPAIWLRCVIAGTIENVPISSSETPVLYLPGIGRSELRAVDSCPDYLKAIVELQFRGNFWNQVNSKDWTVLAYLQSDQGGLGLDVARDTETKEAMILAIEPLFESKLIHLQDKHLDKSYFNTLLSDGDPIRDLLKWLNGGDEYKTSLSPAQWKAFVSLCRSERGFHPDKDGILAGLEKLANHGGPWDIVWDRFCESPRKYHNIPNRLRTLTPPKFEWFDTAEECGGWPQWNEEQEQLLKEELEKLRDLTLSKAHLSLKKLEEEHQIRRNLVWTELGDSPLADSIRYLARLAEIALNNTATSNLEDMVLQYTKSGWQADDAVIQALKAVEGSNSVTVISEVIQSIYKPWADQKAKALQSLVSEQEYPGGTASDSNVHDYQDGDCVLFVDGLRFDNGMRLAEQLKAQKYDTQTETVWTALPSVTATGKAAVSPIQHFCTGLEFNNDFQPIVALGGQSLSGHYFKKLLNENGWTILSKSEIGNGEGKAWSEFGNIDHEGHVKGCSLARYIEGLLEDIKGRVIALLDAGWNNVYIVTDHGWLLMPGGLPKVQLPGALTHSRWGRCAALKEGAVTKERAYPWYWNPNHHFTLATGIGCYIANQEYSHGGLSFQECLVIHLKISSKGTPRRKTPFHITDVVWKSQRCNVALDGDFTGLKVDIRRNAGDASSSIVMGIKTVKETGLASVVVEDTEMVGETVFVVVIDDQETLLAQYITEVGKEDA